MSFEDNRFLLQCKLDSQKSQIARNKLGQFSTPYQLAFDIITDGLEYTKLEQSINFLDPAIGTGVFYSALHTAIDSERLSSAYGFEIDPHYSKPTAEFWRDYPITIINSDFTCASPNLKANLIVCNPPYVRHHHLSKDEKVRLQHKSSDIAQTKFSQLSGLYCHFVVQTKEWLDHNGVAGFLIPSEFMDVNYGKALKTFLLKSVKLLRIHRFDSKDVQFSDALVSSSIVWFKNAPASKNDVICFTYGDYKNPKFTKEISVSDLQPEEKWTPIFEKRTSPTYSATSAREPSLMLRDIFDIKRGIATGFNEFFILTKEQVIQNNIPDKFLRPLLPSPRYIKSAKIEADNFGNPILNEQLFLLSCNSPESEIKKYYPSLWKYLESGKDIAMQRFLCKSRPLWYMQEQRDPPPIVCTYMGRGINNAKSPIRFILNKSLAIGTNSYLLMYPKGILNDLIKTSPHMLDLVWGKLDAITQETMRNEGRVYGGGLQKIEPKELEKLPIPDLELLLTGRCT